jgi:hypothetical protein
MTSAGLNLYPTSFPPLRLCGARPKPYKYNRGSQLGLDDTGALLATDDDSVNLLLAADATEELLAVTVAGEADSGGCRRRSLDP